MSESLSDRSTATLCRDIVVAIREARNASPELAQAHADLDAAIIADREGSTPETQQAFREAIARVNEEIHALALTERYDVQLAVARQWVNGEAEPPVWVKL